MKLSQIVKFVVKKKITKLFTLRSTQKNPIEKFLKTLETSQRFALLVSGQKISWW